MRFIDEVASLPAQQADVLVPLIATALLRDAPEGVAPPPSLAIEGFWASVTRATAEATHEAVSERLRAAGISGETFQGLALRAGLAEVHGDLGALGIQSPKCFEPRAAPKQGQTRAGALARFELAASARSVR